MKRIEYYWSRYIEVINITDIKSIMGYVDHPTCTIYTTAYKDGLVLSIDVRDVLKFIDDETQNVLLIKSPEYESSAK